MVEDGRNCTQLIRNVMLRARYTKLLENIVTQAVYDCQKIHRRSGLEIFGGGGGGAHEFARLAPKAREPLGGSGAMLHRKILKNRVSLMPFPAFWCGFLCMEQVTNEKKILRILVKQNMNRKIARLLSKNCPTN